MYNKETGYTFCIYKKSGPMHIHQTIGFTLSIRLLDNILTLSESKISLST